MEPSRNLHQQFSINQHSNNNAYNPSLHHSVDHDLITDKHPTKTLTNTPLESFMLGLVVGLIHLWVGHPLDTIKTRLQTHSTKRGLFRNLYSGVLSPAMSVPFSWSMYWSIYHKVDHLINPQIPNQSLITYITIFASGAISGGLPCLIISPTDLIKCYAQKYHLSTLDAFKSIRDKFMYQKSEVVLTSQPEIRTSFVTLLRKGIYRGFVSNLLRDMPGMGMYFLCLELCRNNISGYNDSSFLIPFMCGTINGTAYWFAAFPGDCIKSKIQTDFVLAKNIDQLQTASFTKNLKMHIQRYGVRSLYKGFTVILVRNPIVSGTGVVGLEMCQKYLNEWKMSR